jgi:protein O-GlcNAc transferase
VPEPPPESPESQFQHALALHQQGRLADAERLYIELLQHHQDHADAWHLLGLIAVQTGRPERAAGLIGNAIALNPQLAPAHNNRGIPLRQLGRLDEALASYDQAIALAPDYAEAHNNRGYVLLELDHLDEALAGYDTAIALQPAYAEAHNNRGIVLRRLGRLNEALTSYDHAITLRPDNAETHRHRGNTLLDLARPEEALAAFDTTIALKPNDADAHLHRGTALLNLERSEDALSSYDRALTLKPDHAAAHGDRGNALRQLRRPDEALASYDRAIALNPNDAGPYFSRGELLRAEGRTDDAVSSLEAALAIDPLHGAARLAAVMAELPILYRSAEEMPIRRQRYLAALARLEAATEDRAIMESVATAIGAPPFYLPYQGENDVEPQSTYGQLACRALAKTPAPLASLPTAHIRLGIVSGFFRPHTIMKLFLEGWLTTIDRDRFEVIGFHTGRGGGAVTDQAAASCDGFVQGLPSNTAWRQAISDAAPHVLLYPEVGMDATVGWLAAQRLAPVQCVAWGHPETTGMPTMDYFLTSDLMEPPDGDAHYTERLVRLPRLGLHYTPDEEAQSPISRAEIGLNPAVPLYWSGQSLYKYSPEYDWIFPRIAKAAGPCQFVFISTLSRSLTDIFRQRLGRAFAQEGLDAEAYCVILPRMPHDRFMAVVGLADVILDPPGWSGGKSTLDCLAQNPAIVTLPGRFMRGRHTAAILRQIGCEATVAGSLDDYVSIAVRLGLDPAWRAAVKQAVAAGKHRAFRDHGTIRTLETFLVEAVARL